MSPPAAALPSKVRTYTPWPRYRVSAASERGPSPLSIAAMPPPPNKYFQLPMPPVTPDADASRPTPKRPKPLLRLEIRDLALPGARVFLQSVDASKDFDAAVTTVLDLLYPPSSTSVNPPTRSVTLIIRSLGGVAYTTGIDLDDDHKEIHFSAEYISGIPESRRRHEIMGVLVHEMVHCWQWNAEGTAPGGLIEGIADWVRLRADLSPPHWKKEAGGDWDAGYQHTGYFLDWLEDKFGDGTVVAINQTLSTGKYEEKSFWSKLFKTEVESLWKEYEKSLEKDAEAPNESGQSDSAQ